MKVLMINAGIKSERMSMTIINICLFDINKIRFEVNCIGDMEVCANEIVGETSIEVRMPCDLQVVKIAEETYGTCNATRELL